MFGKITDKFSTYAKNPPEKLSKKALAFFQKIY